MSRQRDEPVCDGDVDDDGQARAGRGLLGVHDLFAESRREVGRGSEDDGQAVRRPDVEADAADGAA